MKLGETIHLGLHDYMVVGITGKMVSSGGDPVAYVSLADAQDIQFKKDNDAIRNDRARNAASLSSIKTLSPSQADAISSVLDGITTSTHVVNTVVARIAPSANLGTVQERIGRWNHYRAMLALISCRSNVDFRGLDHNL